MAFLIRCKACVRPAMDARAFLGDGGFRCGACWRDDWCAAYGYGAKSIEGTKEVPEVDCGAAKASAGANAKTTTHNRRIT